MRKLYAYAANTCELRITATEESRLTNEECAISLTRHVFGVSNIRGYLSVYINLSKFVPLRRHASVTLQTFHKQFVPGKHNIIFLSLITLHHREHMYRCNKQQIIKSFPRQSRSLREIRKYFIE